MENNSSIKQSGKPVNFYCNGVQIIVGAYDFRLELIQPIDNTNVEKLGTIFMSPQHAKALALTIL